MSTLFTRILDGEIPGTFVYRDDRAAAFMTINPIRPGHLLVIPVEEYDHWLDVPTDLMSYLFEVSRKLGVAQQEAFGSARVGMIIAGFDVPHVHIHLIPTDTIDDLSFANAASFVERNDLEVAAELIRAELRLDGDSGVVNDD